MPFRRFSLHRPFRMTEIRLSGLFLSLDRRSLPPLLARLLSSPLVSSRLVSSLRRSPSFRIISEGERTPCPWSFCLGWSEIGRRPCLFPALSTNAVVLTRRRFGLSEIPGLRIRASPVRRRDVPPFRSMPFAGARTFRATGPKNRLNRMQASFPVLRAGR